MGVVYHGNYFVYMEIGRVEGLRARGLSYREMEEAGFRIPVLHASCDFKRPLYYDDEVRVRSIVEEITRTRLTFRYELYCDARQELAATGMTKHAFFDRSNRIVRIPLELLGRLTNEG